MKHFKKTYKKLFYFICETLGIYGLQKEQRVVKKLLSNLSNDSNKLSMEKRRFLRARVGGYIIARPKSDFSNNFMKVLGISFGGALLESNLLFKKEQTMFLKLYLPLSSTPVEVKARVVRVIPRYSCTECSSPSYRMGIEFVEISRKDKERLLEAIHSLIKTGNSFLSQEINNAIVGKAKTGEYYSLARKRYFNYTIRTLIYLMEASDKHNHRHSENVVRYVTKIAKGLGLTRYEMLKIKIAALMHDLGKCQVDKSILHKHGKLTRNEWRIVMKHPKDGADIVKGTGILKEISDTIEHHHEMFSGGGYPDPRKKGEDIPLGARIISVADSYDAMVSNRFYRDWRMTRKEAMRELNRCSGTQFDPKIVAAFI